MKKILCLLCILALAAGLLAACGKSNPTPPPPGFTTAGDTPPANNNEETEPVNGGDGINSIEDFSEALNQLGQMFSTNWPENEFTKQVPKPSFETSFGGITSENEFSVICVASIDQLKDYVKELQKKGFTKNADTTDMNMFGAIYNYTADNGKGYTVDVNSALGISTITVRKG